MYTYVYIYILKKINTSYMIKYLIGLYVNKIRILHFYLGRYITDIFLQ